MEPQQQTELSLIRQKRRAARAAAMGQSIDTSSSQPQSKESSPQKSTFSASSTTSPTTDITPILPAVESSRRRRQQINNQMVSENAPDTTTNIVANHSKLSSKMNQNHSQTVVTVEQNKNKIGNQFDGKILTMKIHGCDTLQTNQRFIHKPAIRTHILDYLTGKYLKKMDPKRSVVTFYDKDSVQTILPVITEPFDVRRNHSLTPAWNETIVYNESFPHLINENTIIFFELLDLAPTTEPIMNDGWLPIAWAFLKPVSFTGKPHVGSQLRLQLFKYPEPKKLSVTHQVAGVPSIYQHWKERRIKYSSTLHVSLLATPELGLRATASRPKLPIEIEIGAKTVDELLGKRSSLPENNDSAIDDVEIPWRRMLGQKCRIPNKPVLRIDSGKEGCFTIAFSSTGFYLAMACVSASDQYLIKIYDTITGVKVASLAGHHDLVHELQWSEDEMYLMSASSDGSARVWNVHQSQISNPTLVAVFQHPCFVYTAQFCPFTKSEPRLVITGGFDHDLRCWKLVQQNNKQDASKVLPTGIIPGHESFVVACAFNQSGSRLFSADGNGEIRIWECSASDDGAIRVRFSCLTTVSVSSMEKTPISSISVHPSGRKLLVHTRTNRLKLLDLRLFRYIAEYSLPTRTRARLTHTIRRSIISPCGHFVFASGNNDDICVFSLDSTKLIAQYSQTGFEYPVTCVSFHPFDHSVAFASLGSNQPVLVYTWDETVPPLEITNDNDETAGEQEVPEPLFNVPTPTDYYSRMGTPQSQLKHHQLLLMNAQLDGGARALLPRSQPGQPGTAPTRATLRSLSGATTEVAARSAHT